MVTCHVPQLPKPAATRPPSRLTANRRAQPSPPLALPSHRAKIARCNPPRINKIQTPHFSTGPFSYTYKCLGGIGPISPEKSPATTLAAPNLTPAHPSNTINRSTSLQRKTIAYLVLIQARQEARDVDL